MTRLSGSSSDTEKLCSAENCTALTSFVESVSVDADESLSEKLKEVTLLKSACCCGAFFRCTFRCSIS